MDGVYRSVLLDLPSATELPDAETSLIDARGVAWHYGDPLGEQRAMDSGPVLIDRSHRQVLAVSGPDAADFLNTLLSQKLIGVSEGFSASALDLDVRGHILHHVDIVFHDGVFYLDFPSYQHDSLKKFLQDMKFRSNISIDDTTLVVLTVLGPDANLDGLAEISRPVAWTTTPRTDVLVPRERLQEVADQATDRGIRLAGLMTFTAARIQAGEPEMHADLDEKAIPHEAPYLINRGERIAAVHLDKGCYRGQETVGRVENLGRSPRLLVKLQLDGSAPTEPEIGADITAGSRKVGRLGTVVDDADEGPIALALVKRSAVESSDLFIETEAGYPISASVDPDSLPTDEGEKAGRKAVESLRRSE